MNHFILLTTIGYVTALVLADLSLNFPLVSSILGAVGLWLFVVVSRRYKMRVFGIGLGIGITVLGTVRVLVESHSPGENSLNSYIGGPRVLVEGRISGPVQRGPKKSVAIVNVEKIKTGEAVHPAEGLIRLSMWGVGQGLGYGSRVRVRTRLRAPAGLRNPGVFDYGDYLERQGIQAVASVGKPEWIEWEEPEYSSPMIPVYRLRERIRRLLVNSLSPRSSSLYQAMIIGETRPLTHETRKPFMISGTVHLLSISGSHLAMVAWMVFQGTRGFFRLLRPGWILALSRRVSLVRFPVLITVFPVVGYTLLSGSQVETVRAMVMVLVYLAACWVQRSHHSLNALALSALLVLVWDSHAVFSVSFQLSYMTVLALILFSRRIREDRESPPLSEICENGESNPWWRPAAIKIREALVLSLVAGVATFPLTAYYFNQISWVGFGANLLAIPFVGFILVPLGLVSSLGGTVFGSDQIWFPGLLEFLAEALFSFVQIASSVPGAEVYVPSPPGIVLLAVYGIGGILIFPNGGIFRKGVFTCALFLIVGIWVFRLFSGFSDSTLRIVFFDVGQGDGAWVHFPDGKSMIIDGGRSYENFDIGRFVIAPFLTNSGQRKIDVMVATHPQLDHAGGLETLVERFRVGEVWTNGQDKKAPFYERFRSEVRKRGIRERTVSGNPLPVLTGEAYEVRVLGPPAVEAEMEERGGRMTGGRENDQSVVLRIRYKNEVIMFTGDIENRGETALLRWGGLLRSTILKVPHHGSRSSILPEFIEKVGPEHAVISVGRNNPYRHPSSETLDAYREIRSVVYRTDQEGAIILKTDGDTRIFQTASDFKLKRAGYGNPWFSTELENFKIILNRYWHGPIGGRF